MGGLAGQCQWKRCRSTDPKWTIEWSTNCRKHATEHFCDRHGKRISQRRNETFTCWCDQRLYFYDIRENKPPAPVITPYDTARQAWLDHGYLADKDKMVDAVTLWVPDEWDVYGSIMYDKPAPVRQHRIPALVAGQVAVVAVLIIVAFMLGAMLT